MMEDNKLDKLIEQNITEARHLWLATLPHKEEIPRHRFTLDFKYRIRRIAGMQYTLLYFLKLLGMGMISIVLEYMPVFFTLIPLFPAMLFSSTESYMTKLAAISSIFVAPIVVYFLRHLWYRLGEWSRSREMGAGWMSVMTVMALPAGAVLVGIVGKWCSLPDWVGRAIPVQFFAEGLGPFQLLAGHSIFEKLFLAEGALLWLMVYTGVFYAGNHDLDLSCLWRPLYVMGYMAGLYEALLVLALPQGLFWCKVGYLLAVVWEISVLGKAFWPKYCRMLLAVAIAIGIFLTVADMTDRDEITPRAMPLFANTIEDIFPGGEMVDMTLKYNGAAIPMDDRVQSEVWEKIRAIDFGKMRETDSETIGSWRGPVHIVVEIEHPEHPCTITLAQVPARIDGAVNRVYRLGLAFESGEEYVYTGDDPSQLPLTFFAELPKGAVVPEGEGIEAVFTFDLQGYSGEVSIAQDIMISTTTSSWDILPVEGLLTDSTYTCRCIIPEDTQYLFIHPPAFYVMTIKNDRPYWERIEAKDYRFECQSDVMILDLPQY